MALPTSRGFLLVLLLATVTCIVVVQISMDGWILNGASNFYEIKISEKKSQESLIHRQVFITQSTPKLISNTPSVVSEATPAYNRSDRDVKTTTVSERSTSKISPTNGFKKLVDPPKFSQNVQPGQFSQSIQVKTRTGGGTKSDSSQRIKPLLIDRRVRLKEILNSSISFARAKNNPLKVVKKLPIVDPRNVTNVILITYFRCGSSFVGELLEQNWKTFYQFEPLHYMTYNSRISENRTQEAFHLFRSIYTCDFSNLDTYFKWVRRSRNQFLFSHNLFLWFYCRTEPRLCFSPEFVSEVCRRSPVRLTKVTRLRMRQLKNFIEENNDLQLKVIYLMRDPRGIISSRWTLDWCNGTDCSDPEALCEEMADDMEVFEEMANQQPSKFISVRYENMALNPMSEAHRLFDFLKVPFPRSLNRFLKSHTTARKRDNLDPYSTRRNSSSVAFSWKQKLSFGHVKTIQDSCYDVLEKLNYSLVRSPEELGFDGRTTLTSNSSHSVSIKHLENNENPPVAASQDNSSLTPLRSEHSKTFVSKNFTDVSKKNFTEESTQSYESYSDFKNSTSTSAS